MRQLLNLTKTDLILSGTLGAIAGGLVGLTLWAALLGACGAIILASVVVGRLWREFHLAWGVVAVGIAAGALTGALPGETALDLAVFYIAVLVGMLGIRRELRKAEVTGPPPEKR